VTEPAPEEPAREELAPEEPAETTGGPAVARGGGRRPPRWRWAAYLAAVALVGSALGYALAPSTKSPDAITVGNKTGTPGVSAAGYASTHARAATWTLPALTGRSTTLALKQFAGRPVVVNFWASWCPPCRQEMPALAAMARRYGGRVAFVGVDTNDQRSAALSFMEAAGVTYPVAFDANGSVAAKEGLFGLPDTLFISRAGVVVGRQLGPMSESRIETLVKRAFGSV
jgi:cytochrome c biogenesis protein CcmG/thiol:disulfide interchange protein DsbE